MSHKELEAALREGGQQVSHGKLRVDSKRALQRLRDFRFADPSHWVLEVLRSAVLSGAKRVTVRTDADDVEVAFDGRPFPPALMQHLLEQALNPGEGAEEKRTRLLALGVAGALGVGARFVKVRSGGVSLLLQGERVEVEAAEGTGTTLHLRKALGWRVATALLRGSPEAHAITARAQRFPAALTLNGQLVEARPTSPLVRRQAVGPGWRLETHLLEGAPRLRSELAIDVCGVEVVTRPLELEGLQVQAWLRADEVQRNASGSDVVDGDPTLEAAVKALRQHSLEVLEEAGPTLSRQEDWSRHFLERLSGEALSSTAQKLLFGLPLLTGPAGERLSLDEVHAAAREEKRVLVASRPWPAGSYPAPAVLLKDGDGVDALLPDAKRVDVETFVRRREKVAENRNRLAQMPVEEAVLSGREFIARAPLEGERLGGEVGFERGGNGAFVRVLHEGRLFEAGELPLSPLRLRAVVDWRRPLGDAFFEDEGSLKVFSLVERHVETAAVRAVCEALPNPEMAPHALDLLTRLVLFREHPLKRLPPALVEAPLFPTLGAEVLSLAQLEAQPHWPYVTTRFRHGLLRGGQVLLLTAPQRDVLKKLGHKRLEDVSEQLTFEEGVRKRLAGPTHEPVLRGVAAKVPLRGEHFHGEVGVPLAPGARLSLTLLKQGLLLEDTELSPRFHHAVAIVESPALEPNARWSAVVRDETFKAITSAVNLAQRELAVALTREARRHWELGGELFFAAFVRKELGAAELDELARTVSAARVFQGAHGPRSFDELRADVQRDGRLLVLAPNATAGPVPQSLQVLREPPHLADAVAEALGVKPEPAGPVLEALEAKERLLRLPQVPFELPPRVALVTAFDEGEFPVLAGLEEGVLTATVEVHNHGRLYSTLSVEAPLPLRVLVDASAWPPTSGRTLSAGQQQELRRLVHLAALAVLRSALRERGPVSDSSRRAKLLGLGAKLDLELTSNDAAALRKARLFPCTDGVTRSFHQLDEERPQYVRSAMEGVLPNKRPIVVAESAEVRTALRRWPRAELVESQLAAQLEALEERAAVPQVKHVRCGVASPYRLFFEEQGLRGEVVVASEGAGRLELFLEQRPLCTVEGALPAPLAAAVDTNKITPEPGLREVVRDAAFDEVVEAVTGFGSRLAAQLATSNVLKPEPALVALCFQVGRAAAWEWKGKKKGRGKKAASPAPLPGHPLLATQLLRASDAGTLSVLELIAAQREQGKVEFARRGGRYLAANRRTWWPRADEEAWALGMGLTLDDVTEELELAESIRQRPRFAQIASPLASRWREPVTGHGLEGEVAVGETPSGTLTIEVLHERMALETWSSTHPVGGVARVDSSEVTPGATWTGVKRDAAFKALVQATEAALERLVLRRLAEQPSVWGPAALRWRLGAAGALAGALPGLALFADVTGAPVTVGEALELARTSKRVPLASPRKQHAPGAARVLLDDEPTRALLKQLKLPFEDVTAELARVEALEVALTSRRLGSLTWQGKALVRVAVAEGPLRGELALRAEAGPEQQGVMLAREGIAVQAYSDVWPGVVGVVDVQGLTVDEGWTTANPTRAQRALIRDQVERLFLALAEAAPDLNAAEREVAATWALHALADAGVEAPAHLDRLTGVTRALADAPLFLTASGERVTLQAVASEVESAGKVAVLPRGVADGGARCVLLAERWGAPWLAALEALFGKSKVWRVTDLGAWRQATREADPPAGAAEAYGLRVLRRELRLLRAGALGRLKPDDLEDLRLSREGGAVALRYDAQRKLALLDPEHADVARALKEAKARPERLWVLLAAIFGLVNRALEHVTDEHEAQLVLALAGHLATNPPLLRGGEGRGEEEPQ